MQLKIILPILFSLAPALSLPSAPSVPLLARQSGANGATCGSDDYSASAISAAQNAGCNYLDEGTTVGNDDYPHQYRDDEGFSFPVSGPWYEFPILDDGSVFDGSEGPGADRVVFNGDCELAGVITHTGASSYDGFVECDYD